MVEVEEGEDAEGVGDAGDEVGVAVCCQGFDVGVSGGRAELGEDGVEEGEEFLVGEVACFDLGLDDLLVERLGDEHVQRVAWGEEL